MTDQAIADSIGVRICARCLDHKPLSEFSVLKKTNRKGQPVIHSYCKACCVRMAKKSLIPHGIDAFKRAEPDLLAQGRRACRQCHVEKNLTDFADGADHCLECAAQPRHEHKYECKWCRVGFDHRLLHGYCIPCHDYLSSMGRRRLYKATLTGEKVCAHCLVRKPHEAFHKTPQSKDGYRSYCKECVRARRKSSPA